MRISFKSFVYNFIIFFSFWSEDFYLRIEEMSYFLFYPTNLIFEFFSPCECII